MDAPPAANRGQNCCGAPEGRKNRRPLSARRSQAGFDSRRQGWKQQDLRLYRSLEAKDEKARMSGQESRRGSGRVTVVDIDGPAGAGKSTIARHLAAHFGLLNLESGAMYRAFALKALRAGIR